MVKQKVIDDTDELISEKLSDNVEQRKVEDYEELQEDFVNNEISEEEFEQGLDDLFESGDDFLETYENNQETSTPSTIQRLIAGHSDEIRFRLREIGEVVAVFGTIGLTVYAISATNGFIIPFLIPIILIAGAWQAGLIK